MEKNRSTKIVAIAALFIAVIGLSIGFAAFSSTLTIQSAAEVTPDASLWDLQFSNSTGSLATSTYEVTPTFMKDGAAVTAGSGATVVNDDTAQNKPAGFGASKALLTLGSGTEATRYMNLTRVKAYFTDTNEKVIYDFYIANNGAYDAYLKNVRFAAKTATSPDVLNTSNSTNYNYVKCIPAEGTNLDPNATGATACNGIKLTLTLKYGVTGAQSYDHTTEGITLSNGIEVLKKSSTPTTIPARLEIEYANGAAKADGPFTVEFGDITLEFNAVEYAS